MRHNGSFPVFFLPSRRNSWVADSTQTNRSDNLLLNRNFSGLRCQEQRKNKIAHCQLDVFKFDPLSQLFRYQMNSEAIEVIWFEDRPSAKHEVFFKSNKPQNGQGVYRNNTPWSTKIIDQKHNTNKQISILIAVKQPEREMRIDFRFLLFMTEPGAEQISSSAFSYTSPRSSAGGGFFGADVRKSWGIQGNSQSWCRVTFFFYSCEILEIRCEIWWPLNTSKLSNLTLPKLCIYMYTTKTQVPRSHTTLRLPPTQNQLWLWNKSRDWVPEEWNLWKSCVLDRHLRRERKNFLKSCLSHNASRWKRHPINLYFLKHLHTAISTQISRLWPLAWMQVESELWIGHADSWISHLHILIVTGEGHKELKASAGNEKRCMCDLWNEFGCHIQLEPHQRCWCPAGSHKFGGCCGTHVSQAGFVPNIFLFSPPVVC